MLDTLFEHLTPTQVDFVKLVFIVVSVWVTVWLAYKLEIVVPQKRDWWHK